MEYSLSVQFHSFLLSQGMFKEIYRALFKSAFSVSGTEKRLYWGRPRWQYRTWDMREFIMVELIKVEDTQGGGPRELSAQHSYYCLFPCLSLFINDNFRVLRSYLLELNCYVKAFGLYSSATLRPRNHSWYRNIS